MIHEELPLLNVVMKATELCNLKCAYCSVGDATTATMTSELVDQVIDVVAKRPGGIKTKLVWHGGEPTTLGTEWYDYAMASCARYTNHKWAHLMQTNATLITPEWARWLKERDVHVGVSWDGPGDLTDKTRGAGTAVKVDRGLQLLSDAGVDYSLLVVLNKHNYDQIGRIADAAASLGRRFKISPCQPLGRASLDKALLPPPGSLAKAVKFLANRWIAEGRSTDYSAIHTYFASMVRPFPQECAWMTDCQTQFMAVDADGLVYPCGRFHGRKAWSYGHISEGWDALRSSPARQIFAARHNQLRCVKVCKYSNVCAGGCPAGIARQADLSRPAWHCSDYHEIWSIIEDVLTRSEPMANVAKGEINE
jgi:uncharacterized protein